MLAGEVREYIAGAVVRYGSNGEPEGFADAPEPATGITEGLQSKWWEREVYSHGDVSRIIVYEGDDPDQHGPALDLLNGKIEHYHHKNATTKIQIAIEERYLGNVARVIYSAFAEEVRSHEDHDTLRLQKERIREHLQKKMNWEVINTQDLTVRFWGKIESKTMKQNYQSRRNPSVHHYGRTAKATRVQEATPPQTERVPASKEFPGTSSNTAGTTSDSKQEVTATAGQPSCPATPKGAHTNEPNHAPSRIQGRDAPSQHRRYL